VEKMLEIKNLGLFSVEMLMRFLTDLGRDIQIVVKDPPKNRKAHMFVYISSHHPRRNNPMTANS
jgi:hypothetical protein